MPGDRPSNRAYPESHKVSGDQPVAYPGSHKVPGDQPVEIEIMVVEASVRTHCMCGVLLLNWGVLLHGLIKNMVRNILSQI